MKGLIKIRRSAERALWRSANPARSMAFYQPYFDPDHYRKLLGQPQLSEADALEHYFETGWKEGLDPSEKFSTYAYLRSNPDVAAAGLNPLEHYIRFGMHERRHISPQSYQGKIDSVTPEHLVGWCVDENAPDADLEVEVLINGALYRKIKNEGARGDLKAKGLSGGHGGIKCALPVGFMEPGSYTVALRLPNGRLLEAHVEIENTKSVAPRQAVPASTSVPLKVIVPIYNAVEDVEICLDRLKAHTPEDVEILLIDDCSPDPDIRNILAAVEGDRRFRVLANERNLGFTRTVNRGIQEAGEADVILLNSDARVTPKWVEGLRAAAYSRPRVATVTAMSDRAGAFSAPNIGNDNPLPLGVDEITYAKAFRRRSLRLYPEMPTGNGFCMYIRRTCIDEIGNLDAEAFPRGYGEENDFCMRALRAGWVNLIDDATYVFHERTKSFGETKTDLIRAGREVIDRRYPDYKVLIKKYHEAESINLARFRARQALEDCSNGRGVLPRAVFVTATQTGGTPQTNADLMGALAETFETWVLRCDSRSIELSHYENGHTKVIRRHELMEPIEPISHYSREYDTVVTDWLTALDAELVHIRHLAWHSLSLPAIAKQSGARVVYSFHDFYTLCPSLKLLDENNAFCGGKCTTTTGTCLPELWGASALPSLKNVWVHNWREKFANALEPCDGFVTTSHSARERIIEHMPSIAADRFHVIPHGRDFTHFEQLQRFPAGDEPIRILVPGNINEAKGLDIIKEILRLDKTGSFEFHILGGTNWKPDRDPVPRLITHGRYRRESFAEKVRAIAPHFGAVFSIWDETYCHTLTEMWAVGLPVAVLDFPTLRQRVEDSGAGWVLSESAPQVVLERLLAIASDRDELLERGQAAIRWQARRGAGQSRRLMASRYLDVYRSGKSNTPVPNVAVVGPAKRGLTEANALTEIRLWERTRNRLDRPVNYIRMDVDGLVANIRMGTIDAAIIQRTVIPARMVETVTETAREAGVPYIFEIDDNLLDVPPDKDPDGFYASYVPYLERLIRNAARVTTSTKVLAERLRPLNARISIVPNLVSARLWGGLNPTVMSNAPRLLYMGTHTHHQDLELVLPAIDRARARHPGLLLSLVGVTDSGDLPDWVDPVPIPPEAQAYSQFVPWLRQVAADVDLAIAPLVENDFNRFKSGLEILDYAALGLPVLASSVGPYRDLVTNTPPDGVMLLKNSPSQWENAIDSLLQDRAALREKGERLREWVFGNHTIEAREQEYDSLILQELARAEW